MKIRKGYLSSVFGFLAFTALILSFPVSGTAATISPGQTRTVAGPVSAVDLQGRGLVLEIPTVKGNLTIGVTVTEATKFARGMSLENLEIGQKIRLTYTRTKDTDRLVAVSISKPLAPAKAKRKKTKAPAKAKAKAKPMTEEPAKK